MMESKAVAFDRMWPQIIEPLKINVRLLNNSDFDNNRGLALALV
jgi:hypothetical protein